MKVLIGCERTGIGRDAFLALGHDAISCDTADTESPGPHHKGDIMAHLESVPDGYFDLIILHPDCTGMGVCGNSTYAKGKPKHHIRIKAVKWTKRLWVLAKKKGKRVALENPGSVIFPVLRRMGALVQYIQPYQFGHPETKKTGFALHNLPPLVETENVYEFMMTLPKKERHRVWYMGKSDTRGQQRSESYPGILRACAKQWGSL